MADGRVDDAERERIETELAHIEAACSAARRDLRGSK
jgi:uncharacterized membrane protein YebE (DUF533 family)